MKGYKRNFLLLCIMGLLFISSGCDSKKLQPELIDKSVFTGEPCKSPCWHGLRVGQSTVADVINALPSLSFIDMNSVKAYDQNKSPQNIKIESGVNQISVKCRQPHAECLNLYFGKETLTKIDLLVNYKINFREAIEIEGNPDYIGYQIIGHDHINCVVYAVWKSSNLVLFSTTFSNLADIEKYCGAVRDNGKLIGSTDISEINILMSEDISLIMNNPDWYFRYTGMISE